MKNLIVLLLLMLPILAFGQEYGDTSATQKIIVATFDTPFKNQVFEQFAQEMVEAGFYVTVVTPDKFVAPTEETLVIYGEGTTKGQNWNNKLRAYVAKNPNSIYFTTFKRGKVPAVAEGADTISSASKADVKTTVADLVAKAKAHF